MKFITKLFAILLFGIILPFSISQAQNNDKKNPLQSESKAFQFQISDNFNLNSFSGTTFSYKRHLSEVNAKRIGLSLRNSYNLKNSSISDVNQNSSNLDLNISLYYTWMNYTNPESEIKFFYGYGPRIGFGFNKEETDTKSRNHALYEVSGIGYAGIEWFFHSSMSLHAEYRGAIEVFHRRVKSVRELNGNDEINKTNITTIRLGGDGVKFGLSVYF